jgi:nitrogen fixation NifU-like protein
MSELTDLYQDVLLDHSQRPRHFGELADPDYVAEGHNPLCGDQITVFIRTDGQRFREISFTGQACAICTASASLMVHQLQHADRASADRLFDQVYQLLAEDSGIDPQALGELGSLGGVHRFPMRVKCATLPWHTLRAALSGQQQASTE